MRQGQQNRRGRGRSRKPQNPLARNYESNGPDVKIRGTAAHVAEKYMSLARDALSSGDTIAAESYLQHAEHYNRIIMAAHSQAAGPQAGEQVSSRPMAALAAAGRMRTRTLRLTPKGRQRLLPARPDLMRPRRRPKVAVAVVAGSVAIMGPTQPRRPRRPARPRQPARPTPPRKPLAQRRPIAPSSRLRWAPRKRPKVPLVLSARPFRLLAHPENG
jgi:hypothetical protein